MRPLYEQARSRQQIGVATAPTPRGPWTRPTWPQLRTADADPLGFDGRFCTNPGLKALGRMPDTTGDPLLDLVTKALLQNGSS